MNWLKKMLTGADNETPDFMRHLAMFGGITGLAVMVFDVIAHNTHFNWQEFGVGFGAFCAGIGAAVGMKSHTEPPAK